MSSFFYFDYLCEDIQLKICACLASVCDFPEIHRFKTLSKTTNRLCEHDDVLRRASMHVPNYPWGRHPDFHEKYKNYVLRCCNANNPLAIYRVGLFQFFDPASDAHQQVEGLNRIARGAEEGIEQAQKIYGLILICFGGDNKQKGIKILSPFVIPLIPDKVMELELYWKNRRDSLAWRGRPMMLHLKQIYSREDCSCDGLTSIFFERDSHTWDRFAGFEIFPTLKACEYCLWHEVLQLFLDF